MKKGTAILLLLVYSVTALGMAFNFHYCKGHLTEVSFVHFGDHHGCGCDAQSQAGACCTDTFVYQKGDQHQVLSVALAEFPTLVSVAVSLNSAPVQLQALRTPPVFRHNTDRSSPPPAFLLNCTFRI